MSQPSPRSTAMEKPPLDNGKKTLGRQRRENRRVEDTNTRHVTFSKRKAGLWKKAAELCVLCSARVAIVVFSEASNLFAFVSPSADAVLGCVNGGPVPAADDVERGALEALFQETQVKGVEVKAEAARMAAIGKKVVEVKERAGKQDWWEADVDALGEEELPAFAKALQRLMGIVARRANAKDKLIPNQYCRGCR